MQSHFRVEVRNHGRAAIIAVSGELDLASSPALQEELDRLASSDAELLIIDLRELDFMDSTGLSVLVRAHQGPDYGAASALTMLSDELEVRNQDGGEVLYVVMVDRRRPSPSRV